MKYLRCTEFFHVCSILHLGGLSAYFFKFKITPTVRLGQGEAMVSLTLGSGQWSIIFNR